MDIHEITERYRVLRQQLLAERNPEGFWTGRLSSSALSTAVAIVALKVVEGDNDNERINAGIRWLGEHINPDGGFGDTPGSISNVSTTLLCYAAISFCKTGSSETRAMQSMENWLENQGFRIVPETITRSVLKFYGKDYTFSVPILSMLHLCGIIPDTALRYIPMLPFELSLLPSSLYRFFNLRVVSYALPALIGVGIYLHKKNGNNFLRRQFVGTAVRKLDGLLPESGGFLEAIPLTGFVAMCLYAAGERNNLTVVRGIEFLHKGQRDDGAWPIDTDLSSWVTTLSVKALGTDIVNFLTETDISCLRLHLLKLQYRSVHPFNGAKPGGWGWSSFSGSVPDADDTPGAILALLQLYQGSSQENEAVLDGCKWLMRIQNKDGGFPTFCRGWGRLPFDKSCADLTGHALLAMVKTLATLEKEISPRVRSFINRSINKAVSYLEKHQSPEGYWLPLWFGNQLTTDMTNPVYGTAKAGIYLSDCLQPGIDDDLRERIDKMLSAARYYLVNQQNPDGSWGGSKGVPGSIEETSLAISCLAEYDRDACKRAFEWLAGKKLLTPAPIGLYFALLWYDEKLYPVIYYTEALRRFLI